MLSISFVVAGCCLNEIPKERKKLPIYSYCKNPGYWRENGGFFFFYREAIAQYTGIISHWPLLAKRLVKLEDFPWFDINCGSKKVIEKPHPFYEGLIWEFYINFNSEIDIPSSVDLHQTKVRDNWIMFSPEIINDYY